MSSEREIGLPNTKTEGSRRAKHGILRSIASKYDQRAKIHASADLP
jgi:hypothetical protein